MFPKRDILDIERSNFVSTRNKKGSDLSQSLQRWQGWRDSNSQHADLESAALPIGATPL